MPVDVHLRQIRASLAEHTRLVLEAPPGTGKTTRVPPALLDEAWAQGRRVLLLEPRRVAARSAAHYIARSLGCAVGAEVGYLTRHERKHSAQTRLLVVTEGILTRMLLDDPALEDVALVIFDEFHERHLQSDLGLAFALDAQRHLRPDLRVLVMSATLDAAQLAARLDAGLVQIALTRHPLQIDQVPALRGETLPAQIVRAFGALPASSGDVLVFLPGRREIEAGATALRAAGVAVDLLYGELPAAEQDRVLAGHAPGQRRAILATNLAESSLTVPGVTAVIDSGLARISWFDPNTGLSTLRTERIARDSADQRAGRAARLGPGVCLRLWPREEVLRPASVAEILRVDFARSALELAAWGSNIDELTLIDAPAPGLLAQAQALLRNFAALEGTALTSLGRRLLDYAIHPRLAAMIERCASATERAHACDLAVLLDAPEVLAPATARSEPRFAPRVAALNALRNGGALRDVAIDSARSRLREAEQLRQRVRLPRQVDAQADAGLLLADAYPDRIARHQGQGRYLLANGRAGQVPTDSVLRGHDWLVVVELKLDDRDGRIVRGEALDYAALIVRRPELLTTRAELALDPVSGRVSGSTLTVLGAIEIERRADAPISTAQRVAMQLSHLASAGLPERWFDSRLTQWLDRVAALGRWQPELALPDLSREALAANTHGWLEALLTRHARFDAVVPGNLFDALTALLDHRQRRALAELAPESLQVPSGRNQRIHYPANSPPYVEVKLQEMFGLANSPTVNAGRVLVQLHLLSPAGRPIQVTSDLGRFWAGTYADVRKDLKGRYPRHPWPEDPLAAQPTHHAKPRGS